MQMPLLSHALEGENNLAQGENKLNGSTRASLIKNATSQCYLNATSMLPTANIGTFCSDTVRKVFRLSATSMLPSATFERNYT